MRYIGVDLHTTQLTVCYLKTSDDYEFKCYRLEEVESFLSDLAATDELAVEATGNSRWLVDLVTEKVSRVVIVNAREFQVIKQSAKKTDRRDALNLARFLAVDLLPESRRKSEGAETIQRLNETRSKLVGLKTALLNKVHALAVGRGRKLKKESISSARGLRRVLAEEWSEIERLELEIISEQIGHLKASIGRLEKAIAEEAEKLRGYRNLISIKGIGARSAGVLLATIGEVTDFADENKLASYFGIVPRVSNSNERVRHGRITKRGNKTARTTLVQCTLTALRCNAYLKKYYERVKERRGHGKAKIAAARKFLGIIYNTLKNDWVFADFNNFVLAE